MDALTEILRFFNNILKAILRAGDDSEVASIVALILILNIAQLVLIAAVFFWIRNKQRPLIPKVDADSELDSLMVLIWGDEKPFRLWYFAAHNGDKNNMSLVAHAHRGFLSKDQENSRQYERLPQSEFMPILHALQSHTIESAHGKFRAADLSLAECGTVWGPRFQDEGIEHVWILQVDVPKESHRGWMIFGWGEHQIPKPPLLVGDTCALNSNESRDGTLARARNVGVRAQAVVDRYLKSGLRGWIKQGASFVLHKL